MIRAVDKHVNSNLNDFLIDKFIKINTMMMLLSVRITIMMKSSMIQNDNY